MNEDAFFFIAIYVSQFSIGNKAFCLPKYDDLIAF